jgi:putative membrane protein
MLPKKMNKDDQAEYDKLNGLSGDAFDKEYILFMAKAHREDLHEFRTEASVAADPGLAAEVVKAAGMIRDHLMLLTKLAADKGVTLPPRPARPGGPPPAGQ